MPYVFYDLETTGFDSRFDQILQFAAVRTDEGLVEVDRLEVRCRLLSYVVPSPGALLLTGTGPRTLRDPGLPSHFEAMRRIHQKLTEWSPGVFLGFNSINFDEGFLRQAFFKVLLPVYLTNSEGNSRADAMRIVQAASVFAPDCLVVPLGKRGRPSFRLEGLSRANGFPHDKAHDAMADVEATLFLVRLVRERAPDVWEAMNLTARKRSVIDILTKHKALILTEFYAGPRSYWVAYCGANPDDDSEHAVFDLSNDPREFMELSVEALAEVLETSPKVVRSVRANRHPILMPMECAPAGAAGPGISSEELNRRAAWIRGNPDFRHRVGQAMRRRYPEEGWSPHVEDQLYQGFFEAGDRSLMAQFHRVDWDERLILGDLFGDPRIKEMAARVLYEERPELVEGQARIDRASWVRARLLDENKDVPWMTIPKAFRELDLLMDGADEDRKRILGEIEEFLRGYLREAHPTSAVPSRPGGPAPGRGPARPS